MQHNLITGKAYNGHNQAELSAEAKARGYKSEAWITFLQAKMSGKSLIKGSKGVRIFNGYREVTDEQGKTKKCAGIWSVVFNADCLRAEKANQESVKTDRVVTPASTSNIPEIKITPSIVSNPIINYSWMGR